MRYTYTTMDTIFSKIERDVTNSFTERDVIEWAGEALSAINSYKSFEEAVAFVEVKNYQCQVPTGLMNLVQIAKDNMWTGPAKDEFCPLTVKKELCCPEEKAPASTDPICLDCHGQPLNDYDIAYYRPYFDLRSEYYVWSNSPRYKARYTPIRASESTMKAGLIAEMSEQERFRISNSYGLDSYSVVQGKVIRFSFCEGSVAISYLRQITDPETGYPMIPDNYSYQSAIVTYIKWKLLSKACYSGREGACGKADKAEQDWQWYCKQASNVDMMLHGVDEHQNYLDQRSQLIPKNNRYYGFFGNLNQPEFRPWKNT